MMTITLNIPIENYGKVATAAALQGIDVSLWLANKLSPAAIAELAKVAEEPLPDAEK